MANRINKSSKQATKANDLLIPYMDQWELWRFSGQTAQKIASHANLSELSLVNRPAFVIPQQFLNTVDLWILTQDQELVGDMVHLQLENRGVFSNPDEVPIYSFRSLLQDQSRTLTLTTSLDSSFPEQWALPEFSKFDTAINYFPFPKNRWTIWREFNRYIAVLTNDNQVVYSQALSVQTLDADFATELRCITFQLLTDNIAPETIGITFWSPISPHEKLVIENSLSLPIEEAPRPTPVPPKQSFNLTPAAVRIKQAVSKRFAQYRNLGILLGGLYLLATLGFGSYLFVEKREIDQAKASVAKSRPIIQEVQQSLNLWDDLQPVVDKNLHPLYVLKTITDALPKEGVRITEFKQSSYYETFIKGEAKNSGLASSYIAKIDGDTFFPGYNWTGKQPSQNKNNTWSFSQSTTHPNAPAKE
ncbi:MAG: hypothetical protein AAGA18_02410 [Verrucomicrobiota bacterium]